MAVTGEPPLLLMLAPLRDTLCDRLLLPRFAWPAAPQAQSCASEVKRRLCMHACMHARTQAHASRVERSGPAYVRHAVTVPLHCAAMPCAVRYKILFSFSDQIRRDPVRGDQRGGGGGGGAHSLSCPVLPCHAMHTAHSAR